MGDSLNPPPKTRRDALRPSWARARMSAAEEAVYMHSNTEHIRTRHYFAWALFAISVLGGMFLAWVLTEGLSYSAADTIKLAGLLIVGVAICPLSWLLAGLFSQWIKSTTGEE